MQIGVTTMYWKYVKPINSSELVSEFEHQNRIVFPDEYKACVLANNGGRPSKKVFDTAVTKEREIKSLLSFNKNDRETIWSVNGCKSKEFQNKYIAFATDSAGNLICFERLDKSIVFYDHETENIEKISANYTDFINSLYSI